MIRFLVIDIYFLISAVIAHIFNPIPIRIPTKEAKEVLEIHPIIV